MKPRLIILLSLVVILGIYFVTRSPSTSTPVDDSSGSGHKVIKDLTQQDIPGEEPTVPPEFDVRVEVDQSKGKNRLRYSISEKHGYFVETMRVIFWYVKPGENTTEENTALTVPHYINDFIEAKKTFEGFIEVVPAELSNVGGKIGTTENWRGRVIWHNRARMQNPSPLPERPGSASSDG